MEEKDCCRKTIREQEELNKLINRLNRIEGQIRGIRGMLEKNAYCTDILMQSSAASAALNAFNRDLLDGHIRHCVVRDIKEGKDNAAEELIETVNKFIK